MAGGSKINNPWNREGGEGHIFCKSYMYYVCVGGEGRGGGCEEDQNSSISLHVSEMFWGPSPLKCLLLFLFRFCSI